MNQPDPAALAARLAEIRRHRETIERSRGMSNLVGITMYLNHTRDLLAFIDALVHERDALRRLLDDTAKADALVQERDAATVRFDALAEAVLAFHDAPPYRLAELYREMLALARAGRP